MENKSTEEICEFENLPISARSFNIIYNMNGFLDISLSSGWNFRIEF